MSFEFQHLDLFHLESTCFAKGWPYMLLWFCTCTCLCIKYNVLDLDYIS